jgi:phosphopentomutase
MRALLLVLDSVGIGAAPDAEIYGDEGADTIGHIAQVCSRGEADTTGRAGPLALPTMVRLGLGEACRLSAGRVPPGLESERAPEGRYGCAREISKGKDTPSGHWEIAGVPVPFAWGYFPRTAPCFPPDLIAALCERAGLPGILGDCHASAGSSRGPSSAPRQTISGARRTAATIRCRRLPRPCSIVPAPRAATW